MCEVKASGKPRCLIHHAGTRLALSLTRRLVPELDERDREALAKRLGREARDAEMRHSLADPGDVEAWLDQTRFRFETLPMQESYRVHCLDRLTSLEARHRSGEDPIDAARVYVWRNLAGVCATDVGRVVRDEPMRVAFDLDGVLYPHEVLDHWLLARGYAKVDGASGRYSTALRWGMSQEQFFTEMTDAMRAGLLFRRGQPYPDGADAIRAVHAAGHDVVIVTARNLPGAETEAYAPTLQWLRENDLPFAELHVTHRKTDVPFDLIIDDHPGNVAAARAAGRRAVLLDRAWNRDEAGPDRGKFSEVLRELCAPPAESVLFSA
jgi:FMN phosphatase YigB (HAD superfamily)